ncbi:hypothetical protein PNEG_03380 [Pneumocystis murina B123]|uniref:Pre-rRNA-processing protein TSR2 n=1 Tax=Pneumocystis murina (strain B123) TaxID=1069680 RepID=M7NM44_PNEMU|nr:hypothetical protein PNEG_03380 [Pneumocystis murina B123]EMR08211.1 hypothetical protein PNEG_03380 [Pneumocystis murina B123]
MYRRSLPDNQPPNKRPRSEAVLPADFFDSTEIQADNESNDTSPPPSPSYWARERLFDETFEQMVYDERVVNLIKRREEIKNQPKQLNIQSEEENSLKKEVFLEQNASEYESDTSIIKSDSDSDSETRVKTSLEEWKKYFELGASLCLYNWEILSTAVISCWGGPNSGEKRDWLCGVICDLIENMPLISVEEVEGVLLQVMEDEFNVIVEDGSVEEVAKKIITLYRKCKEGEIREIEEWYEGWKNGSCRMSRMKEVVPKGDSEDEEC